MRATLDELRLSGSRVVVGERASGARLVEYVVAAHVVRPEHLPLLDQPTPDDTGVVAGDGSPA